MLHRAQGGASEQNDSPQAKSDIKEAFVTSTLEDADSEIAIKNSNDDSDTAKALSSEETVEFDA